MGEKGCAWAFIRGRNAAFWTTDPRVALCLTWVQSQSDPAFDLTCLARAPDPDPNLTHLTAV